MKLSKAIFKTFFLSLALVANVHFAYAQSGGIIPNGLNVFLDNNGKPLSSGKVYFYNPSTTTPKTTYSDINLTTPNTNPVILDAAGRPNGSKSLFGTGNYRQVVQDKNSNVIWDVLTSSAGSGGGGGTSTGDGDLVGTIKPWAGISAPNQYMFTYGQEVSRTTFSVLFAAITSTQPTFCTSGSPILTGLSDTTSFWIGMSVEVGCVTGGSSTVISKTSSSVTLASNANLTVSANITFFPWGRGNGSTTFNLPDFRGLIPMGNNIMGGIASTNISDGAFGARLAESSGAQGGSVNGGVVNLAASNLPPHTHTSSTLSDPGHGHPGSLGTTQGTTTPGNISTAAMNGNNGTGSITNQSLVIANNTTGITISTDTGINASGTSNGFSILPPLKTTNYIIKVTPDTNSSSASGVTSLGGMTGDIACGAGLVCTGNIITAPNNSEPIVFTTRSAAASQNLTAFTVISTLAYATSGDSGGATFKNIGTTGVFQDTYVVSGTLIGGSGYNDGIFIGVPFGGGNGVGCSGSATVSGGVVISVSFAMYCAGYKVGDVLTPNLAGGSGSTYTITAISTPQASFTDTAGNRWQYIIDKAAAANALQFGCKGDWNGADAGATNNSACLWSALSWASFQVGSVAATVYGNHIIVPRGSYMTCGAWNSTIYNLPISQATQLDLQGYGIATLKQCSTDNGNTHYIELCDSLYNVGQFGCTVNGGTIDTSQVTTASIGMSVLYSKAGQQFVLANNVNINAAQRSCVKYETGLGGAANDTWNGINCTQSDTATNPGLDFNSSSTQHVLTNSVIAGNAVASGTAIRVTNGKLQASWIDIEAYGTGLKMDNPQPGSVYENIQQNSNSCTQAISLTASNTPGNIVFRNIITACPKTIANAQAGGLDLTGNISFAITCFSGACSALNSGNTTISGYAAGQILGSDGSKLSAYSISGSGTTVALTNSPTFTGTVLAPIIAGGSAAGSSLTLESTSSGSPSGDTININATTTTFSTPNSTGTTTVNIGSSNVTGGSLVVAGTSSGAQTWKTAATTSGIITFPAGTVNFSVTGGTSQVVKQTSSGGIFTVGQLACSDLSGVGTGCSAAAGITALTGDVTASGSGSAAATLATAQPAVHTWALAQTFTVAPIFTDQSGSRTALGLGTAATQNTGTSGATIPLLNGTNTWAATQTFATISPTTINAFTAGGAIAMGGNNITGGGTATFTTFSGALTGHASLDLALTGGTMSGAIAMGTNAITGLTTLASAGAMTIQTNGSTQAGVIDTSQSWQIGSTTLTTLNGAKLLISKNAISPIQTGISGVPFISSIQEADSTVPRFASFSVAANSGYNAFRANGTTSSPTAVVSGNVIATFFGFGYATSGTPGYVLNGAGFQTIITETTCTSTACGQRFDIAATPTGGVAQATAASFGAGVMIGTTTDPGAGSLQINAQTFMPNITTSSAAQTGTVCWTTGTGKFTVDTTVGCLTSIMGAKSITKRLSSNDALSIIDRLSPFAFKYKNGWGDDGHYEQFGLGAEEVANVDERLVGRDPEGKLQGVRYQELTAVLTGAIQNLDKRIKQLEK